ncbi:hypothetical protein U9M48_036509 [Paspalum notatum var. saurae]|uniref:RRM domain-containing protein n=1 Tax=Paspalum notatum var. saurae TaxID=547442 RepID=A0AAQ3UHQ8_PASNO
MGWKTRNLTVLRKIHIESESESHIARQPLGAGLRCMNAPAGSVMAAAADPADDAEHWRPWADLPLDLLRDISRHLHAAADYARFHAVCVPWRDALPPAQSRPAFLPWLLAPPGASGYQKARCVFVSSEAGSTAATEIVFPDRRWVIGVEDGVATPVPAHLLCGGETKRWPWRMKHAAGSVSGDGTIFLHNGPVWKSYHLSLFNMDLMHPGDSDWTVIRKQMVTSSRSCLAYSHGKVIICDWHYMITWCTMTRQVDDLTGDHPMWSLPMPAQQYDKAVQSCHLMEFRGELLMAVVLLNHAHYYEGDHYPYQGDVLDKDYYSVGNFAAGLLVTVYALEEGEGGNSPQWVKKDSRSLTDCIMFLGRPSSFAMDAARFGMSSTCCAYFVIKNKLYDGISGKSVLERCRVFKCTFHDDKSELVKQLPAEWGHEECMWLTQQPSIASIEEIRKRLESSYGKTAKLQLGPYFRIYVGNLPRKVDSYRLRWFFSKHGKVADARVMCHLNTKRSRGFGFVTLATTVDDEPAQAIAKLDGQMLDGRPMRVKFAD